MKGSAFSKDMPSRSFSVFDLRGLLPLPPLNSPLANWGYRGVVYRQKNPLKSISLLCDN